MEEGPSGQAPAEQGIQNPFPTPIPHPLALFDLSLLRFSLLSGPNSRNLITLSVSPPPGKPGQQSSAAGTMGG